MIWPSIAWVVLALAAFPGLAKIESPLKSRWPRVWDALDILAPWLIGLGPAYLALVGGAVLASSYGLYGRGGALGWVGSIVLCGILVAVIWRMRLAGLDAGEGLTSVLLDEPRWALYRAVGVPWLGAWSVLAGLAIGGVEWGLRTAPWREANRQARETWGMLLRLAVSNGLFALTGNVWLVWATQGLLWWIQRSSEKEDAA
jgi:hypothetical protein